MIRTRPNPICGWSPMTATVWALIATVVPDEDTDGDGIADCIDPVRMGRRLPEDGTT